MKEISNIEDLLINDSFIRWILGNASEEEEALWDDWLEDDAGHKKLVEEAHTIILSMNSEKSFAIPNPQVELAKLEKEMDAYEEESAAKKTQRTDKSSKYRLLAVAASLLLAVLMGGYMVFQQFGASQTREFQTVQTDHGEKRAVDLKDGSVITLNSDSRLQYALSTEGETIKKIDVRLQGEAYFDVPHHTGERSRVFRVHTKDGIIEDLGTTFAVKTNSQETRAVLASGKIKILVQNSDGKNISELTMQPNEKANFQAGVKSVQIEKVNSQVYTSWVDDRFVFDNTPFSEVAERIEEKFGLSVVTRDQGIADEKLTGSIKSTNLEILKNALSDILDVSVQQKKDTLFIGFPPLD